jgi:hypothetical protein
MKGDQGTYVLVDDFALNSHGVEFLVELGLSSINIERRASGGDLNYQRRK